MMLTRILRQRNAMAARNISCGGLIAMTALALSGCGREVKTARDLAATDEIPSSFEFALVHPEESTPDGRRSLRLDSSKGTLQIAYLDGHTVTRKAVLKVGMQPVSVRAASNHEAWVVDPIADSISIVDLESATVVETVQTAAQPTDVMFSGSPSRAYVTVAQGRALLVFDPIARGEPLTRIALQLPPRRSDSDDI